MRISYRPLFSVECLHGYFADHVCKSLTLRPTVTWAQLQQRHHLLFRPAVGGGAVYYSEQAHPDLLRLSREETPVSFALTSADPFFDIYTDSADANTSPSQTIRYFSNRDVHVAEIDGRSRQLLHAPNRPFAQPPLPVRASTFTHQFDKPLRGAAIQVTDWLGQTVWKAQTPASEVRAWPVDLRGQACGCYRLSVPGRPVVDFYLSDTPATRQWGVVEIFLTGIGEPATFTISLASRETVWRYYIVDQSRESSSPYASYEVVGVRKPSGRGDRSGTGDIRFARKAETVTLNGRSAFVFESKQAVALAEVPGDDDYLFTFRPNGGSERGGHPIRLPFAQPAATKFDPSLGGAGMCSEIFVYL